MDDNGKTVAGINFTDPKAAAKALKDANDQFKNAKLGRKHKKELGETKTSNVHDFRSYTVGANRIENLSLQINIGKTTGLARADLDRFNPGQDVVGIFGHIFFDLFK